MCKNNQMPAQDEHFSPDHKPLEGWDEVDQVIAKATISMPLETKVPVRESHYPPFDHGIPAL